MFEILRHTNFRIFFLAQISALAGTGLATVALGLLAYDMAGAEAGAVLGTALAIKMLVYVLFAPVASALVTPASRKGVLISLDGIRTFVVLLLPWVTEIWQIYLLIAVLQAASACFTPLYQSLIPEILPDERDYTRALSLSRIAYDLESLFSPLLAAILLIWLSFHWLFVGTAFGFLLSAGLIITAVLPRSAVENRSEAFLERIMKGMNIYMRTPRLRAMFALHICAAAGGSMVFVNTVVIVRDLLGGNESQLGVMLAAFGGGSMLVALLLPNILERYSDRQVMLASAALMIAVLLVVTMIWLVLPEWRGWAVLLSAWSLMGVAYAGLVTPGGRLIRRSASNEDLPAVFAAQFSVSHVCWLLAYPLAGWIGLKFGLEAAFIALSLLAVTGFLIAIKTWTPENYSALMHDHTDLPNNHPHLELYGSAPHSHLFVIDKLHRRWPG